jgi:hypothetical protein
MSALIALAAIVIWAWFGALLWKRLIRPRFKSPVAIAIVTALLACIWLIGPVIDEILGAREFGRACQEMPKVKFHGPVVVGPGAFFDQLGNPRWKNSDEFSAIKRSTKVWDQLFDDRQEWTTLQKWPIPILQSRSVYFQRSTGRVSVESYYRTSPGGWLRRVTGWSVQAPYQCPSKGIFPVDEARIAFQ